MQRRCSLREARTRNSGSRHSTARPDLSGAPRSRARGSPESDAAVTASSSGATSADAARSVQREAFAPLRRTWRARRGDSGRSIHGRRRLGFVGACASERRSVSPSLSGGRALAVRVRVPVVVAVEDGSGVVVSTGVAEIVGEADSVALAEAVGSAVEVAEGAGESVGVAVGWVPLGVGVDVAVGSVAVPVGSVAVPVGSAVALGSTVGVAVSDATGVTDGVGVGQPRTAEATATTTSSMRSVPSPFRSPASQSSTGRCPSAICTWMTSSAIVTSRSASQSPAPPTGPKS